MPKHCRLYLLLAFFFLCTNAVSAFVNLAKFNKILSTTDIDLRERELVSYLLVYYQTQPADCLPAARVAMNNLFIKYKVNNTEVFNHFIGYIYQQRLKHIDEAEKSLVKAIQLANKGKDNYLLYAFYDELGFLQTYMGNTYEAVFSFSMAKKHAIALNNPIFQIVVDINISDIFYKNNFYKQSLFYLQQALSLIAHNVKPQPRLKSIVYNNIAENYFRMNELDSLVKYNTILHGLPNVTYKKYGFTHRSDYYLTLLRHDYKTAINQIKALKTDTLYRYDHADEQNLADAYYKSGRLDSAKVIINRLLADPLQNNHPEIKIHLYEVLGKIAGQQHNPKQAAYNFKMGLQQSNEQINRLTQVDNISSQIKLDEMQGSFAQTVEGYKKERLGLVFVLIIAFLTVAIIAMIFSATRQKRYYERLLFDNKKKELSFINSHEVRRHLSNILGLVSLIKHSGNKTQEYIECEEHLLHAAECLDKSIKNISEKLDDN